MLVIEFPEHDRPLHPYPLQGFDVVTPSTLQDHSLKSEILWICVAAMKPHKALSWKEGQISFIVDGRNLWFTVVKHKGAQVINGLELPEDISIYCKLSILHKLEGTVPIK